METSSSRVLVVEDSDSFRKFVCSTLGKRPELQIVGEVSDGLDGVQKAEELQPDLILLDIGLPTLNGIEAARRIRKVSPTSKIIFVTQESSADMVEEALKIGACGYVVKAHAGSELMAAVEAVRQGRLFVSAGLAGHKFTDAVDAQVPDPRCDEEALPSLVPTKAEITPCHAVQVYSDDALFLDGFTRFITAALKAENAVIVVATESHRASLLQRLQAGGVDVAAAIERKRYISLDVPDMFSPVQFAKVVGDLVVEAAKVEGGEHLRVAAGWECTPTLWAQGKIDVAIQLERLWDELAKTHDVNTLCGYVLGNLDCEQESNTTERICAEHSAVYSR